jgi:hypothetical protein
MVAETWSVVAAVAHAAEPWQELFDRSRAVSVAVTFTHLAAMVVAGGLALSTDRGTLAAARHPALRPRQLTALAAAHSTVGAALAAVLASGVLLALADVETIAVSPVFWAKMSLVALLLGNGLLMRRAERGLSAERAPSDGGAAGWRRLGRCAAASAVLWLVVILAGTVLGDS